MAGQSKGQRSAPPASATRSWGMTSFVPCMLGMAAAGLLALPEVAEAGTGAVAIAAAAGLVLTWGAVLAFGARSQGRPLKLTVAPRSATTLLAFAVGAIFVYWAVYWLPLRQAAPLIAAQVLCAYAVDILVVWARRNAYELDLEPFVVVGGVNLFLRFNNEWFYLQFAVLGLALVVSRVRRASPSPMLTAFHPAGLSLALASLVIIATKSAGATVGADLAANLVLPPHMYVVIFALFLPVLHAMRASIATASAVVTTYVFSLVTFKVTGMYFFGDSSVPIAAFLAAHYFASDTKSLPRTGAGKVIWGVAFAAGTIACHAMVRRIGAPAFFAPLLVVPVLNLATGVYGRLGRAREDESVSLSQVRIARASAVAATVWMVAFGGMLAAKGVGDFHVARTIPFWQRACDAKKPGACKKLDEILASACELESGWACNEQALLAKTASPRGPANVAALLTRACGFGQLAACDNSKSLDAGGSDFKHGDPTLLDFPRILRQGMVPVREKAAQDVLGRACDEGWAAGCDGLSALYFRGAPSLKVDKPRAAALALKACTGGHARACSNLGLMYKNGDGVAKDPAKALAYLKKSCDLGFESACRWLADELGKRG